jgi:hypothetical protein
MKFEFMNKKEKMAMSYQFGNRQVTMGSKYLTELKDSNVLLGDIPALRRKMQEDGYLLIRGFHDREQVLQARRDLLSKLAEKPGSLDLDYPLEDGVAGSKPAQAMFGGTNEDLPSILQVANSPRLMRFFDEFLGGESMTFDYKWVRAMGPGKASHCHYDVVYMGRGTKNLYTVWTPIGDVPMEMGSLALCLDSQHFDKVRSVYGTMDIDRDRIEGALTDDPVEIVDNFGGIWATTDFKAGDILIFGMYILHFALKNSSNRYRTSMDTRYQLRSEPADERWVGKQPIGHYSRKENGPVTSVKAIREKIGLETAR